MGITSTKNYENILIYAFYLFIDDYIFPQKTQADFLLLKYLVWRFFDEFKRNL